MVSHKKNSARRSCPKSKTKVDYYRGKTHVVACRTKKAKYPSRGWKHLSPQKGRERNLIMEQCGSKCFLEPKTLGFPVCSSYRKRSGSSRCKRNCKGLLSAYVRSRQWKHHNTSRKAKNILDMRYI